MDSTMTEACVQLGKWEVALKLLVSMERDGTELEPWLYSLERLGDF